MLGMFKRLSMVPKGLRYKLMISFSLMSIIPLLVSMYLASIYVFPHLDNITDISIVILLSVTIAMLGLALAKRLINPVIEMAIEARMIANGDFENKIAIQRDDEIGHLGESINIMTEKIKSNLDELKDYGQRTREINIEIHKKVLALSSLLQIGDIIATGSMELNLVLELAVQKASTIFDSGFGILLMPKAAGGNYLMKTSYGLSSEKLEGLAVKGGQGLLGKAIEDHSVVVIDDAVKKSAEIENFRASYNVKNIMAIPMFSGRKDMGLLLVGNDIDSFKYKNDDIDLIKVFAKQITIAIENDILFRKTEELSIKDDLTGLYNKNYLMSRLEEEIKRAIFYQRPCSLIIFNIDDFKALREDKGELVGEEVIKKVAKLIKESTDPIGKAARIGGDEFAMLIPEKNKRQTTHIAEEIRKKIESTNFVKEPKEALTVSGGVSENPIDGATAEELFKSAQDALHNAKSSGKNRIAA